VLLSSKNRTLQIALTILKNDRLVNYGMIAAGVVMAVIPVYIVFIFFQEQIVRGLYVGAVKG
jgi:ABC-type glycerol-3-phosphate transport system permease component